ncbi:serine protease [Patescibacteria group bacterium]|nr:serine protease [Patescibacteria group bacterium]
MPKGNKIKGPKRPEKFTKFSECLTWLKKSVYIIVRGRQKKIDESDAINWITLGSAFVAAPKRMLTAAHVLNDPLKGDLMKHQDGDKYYLLRHDDDNNWHYRIFEPKLDNDIFIYPEIDLGIIYLDEKFYHDENKIYVNETDFIRISKDFLPIGSEIGVLGYPLSKLEFKNHDLSQPLIGNILLRADQGVVNCRYKTTEKTSIYEFTLAFNPGNSGGPIFDLRTGRLISIVKGYRAHLINLKENIIPEKVNKQLKEYKEKSYIESLHAIYSYGFATPTFLDRLRQHKIMT